MKREELLARLAGYPAKVHTVTAPLTEEQLRRRPGQGEWSIKEVLGHLRDSAELLGERVRRMATDENPYLPEFKEAELAVDRRYQDDVTPVMLGRYVEHRAAMVALLRGLSDEGWERIGNHWKDGRVTVQSTAEGIARHDQEHLGHIRRLREEAQGV